jgi:hypothetical protein
MRQTGVGYLLAPPIVANRPGIVLKAFAAAGQFLWAVFPTIGCNPIVKKQVGEDDERSVTFIA